MPPTQSYEELGLAGRRRSRRHAVVFGLVLLLVGLPLFVLMLRRFENSVTFHPDRSPSGGTWRLPRGGEDVWFETTDGVRLHGWLVRSPGQPAPATVIYCHGNGGNVSYLGWMAEELSDRGFDVLLFDYRGYGRSEGAVAGERGLYADADAAYDFAVGRLGVEPASLILYGQSLGTVAATDLASRKECGALILESGLSSAAAMAGTIFPWLPKFARGLTRNKLDSVGKLPRVRCPVLVAHGGRDVTIPVEQGRELHDAAPEPKKLVIIPTAGHNDLVAVGGERYLDELAAFINSNTRAGQRTGERRQ